MRLGILGPFEVADDQGRELALGGRKQRSVLAILLLHAGEVVSSDRLIDELWGDRAPATAAKTVQVYVSNLRKVLGEGVLVTRAGGYVLQIREGELDLQRFHALVGEGHGALQAGDPRRAAELLREALGVWRGSALADFAYEPFAQSEVVRLDEARMAVIEDRIEAELACGRHAALVGDLEGLVLEHPLRERLHGQLMLALYRSGRQAEALGAYQRARDRLVDELGLEPGSELRALQAAILQQSASLALDVPGIAPGSMGSGGSDPNTVESTSAAGSGEAVIALKGRRVSSERQVRKVVTALSCDVVGSTPLGEELDPEVLGRVMNRYFAELRATFERHGGTVEKFAGDAVMAVFGIPRVREDDALRAVRAGAEIRERMPAVAQQLGVSLRWRAGVNTGLVLMSEEESLAIGDAVNVATRLEQAASPGEILIGAETLRLVRDAVEVEPLQPLVLKGKSAPVPAFRMLRVDPAAPGAARRLDVPLVGRERELHWLGEAWQRSVDEPGCHLFTLLGAAGVGKSRLVAELLVRVGEGALVLRGRCLPYGEGITFWPLLEALRPVGKPAAHALERLGSGGVATPEELYWEVRRLLESLAAERPVILDLDDMQWAEPMLLDLLDHIADLSRGRPILLLCSARPELLEDRAGWAGGKLNATSGLLEPLAQAESDALLVQLGDGLDRGTRARVAAASQGNPLFLEEMAAFARETGTIAAPPTIRALLAARLDRLPVEERVILEHGAIEGEVFHRSAVHALAGERPQSEVDSQLAGLVRKELIRPHPATITADDAFRFRHLLTRDAAYDGVPKATRADLHERFGHWLERTAAELTNLDELAGWHLEQAVRYRHDLGREVEASLRQAAARHLHAAGRRASARGDAAATVNLLERAFALVLEDDALRARIAVDLAEQLMDVSELARVDELLSLAQRDPDVHVLAALTRLEWQIRVMPHEARTQTSDHMVSALLEQLTRAGDERGLARAHMAMFWIHMLAGRYTPAGAEALLAIAHAQKAGDEGLRARALTGYISSIVDGREDARTIAKELAGIDCQAAGPGLRARVDRGRGAVARLEGRLSEARALTTRSLEVFRTLGLPERVAACEDELARIEMAADRPAAALPLLLRSDATLAEHSERGFRSTTQALLAQAYERLGNGDAARAAIDLAEELSTAEDVLNYAITHEVRARLALADGNPDAAMRWALSAVDHACATDSLTVQAQAKLNLARVFLGLGHRHDATSAARSALNLSNDKGDRPTAEQARALLDELESTVMPRT